MKLFPPVQSSSREDVVCYFSASGIDPRNHPVSQEERWKGGARVRGHDHFHHHELWLRCSFEPTCQLKETLPLDGYDVSRSKTNRRSDALLSRMQNSREAGQEDCSILPAVRRATIQAVPLRFWPSYPKVRDSVKEL